MSKALMTQFTGTVPVVDQRQVLTFIMCRCLVCLQPFRFKVHVVLITGSNKRHAAPDPESANTAEKERDPKRAKEDSSDAS